MGAFVNPDARETIADDNGNSVTIRAKMSIANRATVAADTRRFENTRSGQDVGLLAANIVEWEGPLFQDDFGKPVPCTRRNIFRLDPTNADWLHLQNKVLKRIDELNIKPTIEENGDPN